MEMGERIMIKFKFYTRFFKESIVFEPTIATINQKRVN